MTTAVATNIAMFALPDDQAVTAANPSQAPREKVQITAGYEKKNMARSNHWRRLSVSILEKVKQNWNVHGQS